ncbi:MAG TPA: UDP-3-O-(3-hydroxymyristoyl)glucosamine N-acyltransferase [Longimicrobiales bacterium]|nr:UDP-3-O-(3-hydroxymyristoyl)glucosamine N-acyltransferase [Longimicrobiales bacterium]
MRASEIARLVGGTFESGAGDPELVDVAPLDRAGPEHLTFLADPKYLLYLEGAQAGAVLISESLTMRGSTSLPRIVVRDVHGALATLLARFHPEPAPRPGIHSTAVIGAGVRLGEGVTIGPYAILGDQAVIGARSRIGPHAVVGAGAELGNEVVIHAAVTLYPGVRLGDRCIIHSGARIGSDGYGYTWADGGHRKVPQVGGCILGRDVEVGANSTIDRGSVGATEIGNGVKIDNLVHIGHNVRIGDHTLIIAQVGISGSVTIGSRATLAGQVGVSGHLKIGDGVVLTAKSGVWGSLTEPGIYSGHPARPHKETLRQQASLARLPRLIERLRALEQAVFGRNQSKE